MENKTKFRIAISVLCAVYVAVRLWRLTDECLWFDEIFSVHAAEHTWSGMWWFVARDLIHPPLYYGFLKVWIEVGGESLLWLRLFPVFFAVLAVPPFLYLCRELKLNPLGIAVALLLFAVNGFLIKYAQEVRMYSLFLCLSIFSIWIFSRFFYLGKNIWILTLVNILLIYTHYFGWLVVAAELLTILVVQRIKIRHLLIMAGTALAAFVPWLITVARAAGEGSALAQNIGWIGRPGLRENLVLLLSLVEPFYSQASNIDQPTVVWFSIPMVVVFAVATAAYVAAKDSENRERIPLLSICIAMPITIAWLLSWLMPYSIWGSRHLIFIFPLVAILFAIFLSEAPSAILRNVMLAAIAVVSGSSFVRVLIDPRADQVWCAWEKIPERLPSSDRRPIYTFEDLAAYHIWFAQRKIDGRRISEVKGVAVSNDDPAYFLPRGFEGVDRVNIDEIEDQELWLVFRVVRFGDEFPVIEAFTNRRYRVCTLDQTGYGPNRVFLARLANENTGCSDLNR